MTTKEIVLTFPEPFKSAVKYGNFNIDYKLHEGKSDHKWLEENGYELWMGSDCTYNVDGLPNLNATSYGDWGSVYNHHYDNEETLDGFCKSFCEFCRMYEEGIVKLWRIRIYIDEITYDYNHDAQKWKMYENYEWKDCTSPFK